MMSQPESQRKEYDEVDSAAWPYQLVSNLGNPKILHFRISEVVIRNRE
jgi:hypothetical protein